MLMLYERTCFVMFCYTICKRKDQSRKGPGEPEASRPAGRYNAKFDKPNDYWICWKITDESNLEIVSESYVRFYELFLCKNLQNVNIM